MRDGAVAGYKYFLFETSDQIQITVSGKGKGKMLVSDRCDLSNIIAEISVNPMNEKKTYTGRLQNGSGIRPLYFRYQGEASIDFYSFTLGK